MTTRKDAATDDARREAEVDAVVAPPTEARLMVGPVTRTQIVRFAGAGGDFNPMHHDEPFAQAAGQPGVFAMGQLSAALLGRLARDWLGEDQLRSLSVRFTAKVWPGDELELTGRVTGEETVDGELRRVCELQATDEGGEVAARGTATASASPPSRGANVG